MTDLVIVSSSEEGTLQAAKDNCVAIALLLRHGHITAAIEVARETASILDWLEAKAEREARLAAQREARRKEDEEDEDEDEEEDEEEEDEEEETISSLLEDICTQLTFEQETAIASVIGKLPSGRAFISDTAALAYLMQRAPFPLDARERLQAILRPEQWPDVERLVSAVRKRMTPTTPHQEPPPPPRARVQRPVRKRLSAKERSERIAKIEASKEPKKPAPKRTKKLEKKNR